MRRLASDWVISRRPSSTDSSYFMRRRKWRISARALPVRAKVSQEGLGRALGSAMISMMSPWVSSVRSGTGSPLMRAATHWLPRSVCTL